MIDCYVSSYKEKVPQAKLNEVFKKVKEEIAEYKPNSTVQDYGEWHYEGYISVGQTFQLTPPLYAQEVVGYVNGIPVDIGTLSTNGVLTIKPSAIKNVPKVVTTISYAFCVINAENVIDAHCTSADVFTKWRPFQDKYNNISNLWNSYRNNFNKIPLSYMSINKGVIDRPVYIKMGPAEDCYYNSYKINLYDNNTTVTSSFPLNVYGSNYQYNVSDGYNYNTKWTPGFSAIWNKNCVNTCPQYKASADGTLTPYANNYISSATGEEVHYSKQCYINDEKLLFTPPNESINAYTSVNCCVLRGSFYSSDPTVWARIAWYRVDDVWVNLAYMLTYDESTQAMYHIQQVINAGETSGSNWRTTTSIVKRVDKCKHLFSVDSVVSSYGMAGQYTNSDVRNAKGSLLTHVSNRGWLINEINIDGPDLSTYSGDRSNIRTATTEFGITILGHYHEMIEFNEANHETFYPTVLGWCPYQKYWEWNQDYSEEPRYITHDEYNASAWKIGFSGFDGTFISSPLYSSWTSGQWTEYINANVSNYCIVNTTYELNEDFSTNRYVIVDIRYRRK